MTCPLFLKPTAKGTSAYCELDRMVAAYIGFIPPAQCLNNQSRCLHPEARDVEIAARNRPVAFLTRLARRNG